MTDKDRTPVARDITTECTRCNLELRHVVVAHNSQGIVATVRCYTCGSEHKYHPERKQTARGRKGRPVRQGKRASRSAEYAQLLEQNSSKEIVPYSMFRRYDVHDIIEHKTFGRGVIIKVNNQKMDVLFETEERILACNR